MITRLFVTASAGFTALAFTPTALAAQQNDESAVAKDQSEGEEHVDLANDGTVANEQVFEYTTEEEEELQNLQDELAAEFAIFGELFSPEPLTDEQEARLPLARQMTDKVFPEGTFGVVMQQSLEPMMNAIMGMATSDPRTELANLTGVPADDLIEINDEDAQSALDILDPQNAQRNEKLLELVNKMMAQMFDAIEPSYRDALARAFAVRFADAEIEELLVFFETPVGDKFARESFLVQYDPQIMGAMEAMGPAMGQVLPSLVQDFEEFAASFPDGRRFTDLSSAERGRISQLLGKGEAELEALAPEAEEEFDEDETPIT